MVLLNKTSSAPDKLNPLESAGNPSPSAAPVTYGSTSSVPASAFNSTATTVAGSSAQGENQPLLFAPDTYHPAVDTGKPLEPSIVRRRRYYDTPGVPRIFAIMGKTKEFIRKLETRNEAGLTNAQLLLTNEDLKPVEPERRQWGPWNFVAFWIADSFNINTWMISSAMIMDGLSWWQAWLCVWIGYLFSGIFVSIVSRIGAVYHVGFPVVARSSFGIWGSLWPVFNRAAMACIWYGVQAWIGGTCVKLMIRSIWTSYNDVPNTMSGSGTETKDWTAFFIFWLCSLPALWFPVHKIRHLFTVKSYVVPVAGFAFFGWAISRAGGLGPIVHQPSSLTGSALAWAFVKGVMSSLANFATLIVNAPDFSRFATKPRDSFWSQLFAIPIGFAFTSFIGIIVSSSSSVLYEKPIWDPLDLLDRILQEGGAKNRTGVFFISTAFALAQLGTNIAANSVSAGTDLTALLPRFINIRRGSFMCAAIGLAMCPWHLLSSANNFTLYLSSYSVFLSAIAGVMICDYYFVRRGYLEVKNLYSARKTGPYYFTAGVHWRAYAAYVAGILINVVGFAGAIGRDVPIGATYIYNLNFFAGFTVSSVVYYVLCYAYPVPACSDKWMEVGEEIEDVRLAYDDEESFESVEDEEQKARSLQERKEYRGDTKIEG